MRPWLAVSLPVSLLLALACGGGADATQAEIVPAAPETPATAGAAAAARPEPAAPAVPPAGDFDLDTVPEDLRSGAAASRLAAIAAHQDDPAATSALVWVMRNDADLPVRKRAWRALRARWDNGVGVGAEHEAAAVWAAANAEEDTRVAALEALGALSRDLDLPARHLADAAQPVRAAAAAAVFAIAGRTGTRADAKKLLQDRLAVESAGPLRKKLDGWVDQL